MSERPRGLPEDAPLPPHLDPRGRGGRRGRTDAPPPDVVPARRRRRSPLRTLALLLAAVLAVTAVTFLGALVYFDQRIDRIAVSTLGGPDVDGGDTNYLIVGTDSRKGLTDEELAQVRTTAKEGGDNGTLTDTILLAHVPAGGGTATFVSFPRDSFVEIPGSGRGRINTAYAIGERSGEGNGPARLVETVEQLSGLSVDHYIEVGFISFLRITDAVGGVEVDLCGAVQDPDSGIDLPAGEQRLQGGDALAFVRQRKGLPRGDLDRVARQQYFLGSVARQVLSPSTLLRPDRVLSLMGAVTSSIRADQDLSTFDLARLGWRLRGVAGGGLAFQTVPVADANATRGGASVVVLDEEALPGFFAGLSPASQGEPPATVPLAPQAIRLAVRNGTDQAGLAARASSDLESQGFTVTETGNTSPVDGTVVLYGANRLESAQTVAGAVPGARLQQDDSVGANGLVLVLGADYDGTRAVTVAPAAGEAPAPPPAGAPAPEAPAEDARPCIT